MPKRFLNFKVDASKQDKFELTSQGFLKCDALVTRSGVFDYTDIGGGKELRPDDEVFDKTSMDSLSLIPITWMHPSNMVDLDTVKEVDIGTTGENIKRDGDHIGCKVIIKNKDAIEEILKRHKEGKSIELSCGYDCETVKQDGEHNGEKYDVIQTKIKYNHLSIVDKGRAGSDAKLKLDAKKDSKKVTEVRIIGVSSKRLDITKEEKELSKKVKLIRQGLIDTGLFTSPKLSLEESKNLKLKNINRVRKLKQRKETQAIMSKLAGMNSKERVSFIEQAAKKQGFGIKDKKKINVLLELARKPGAKVAFGIALGGTIGLAVNKLISKGSSTKGGKYTRRTGSAGNYKYFYDAKKDSSKVTEIRIINCKSRLDISAKQVEALAMFRKRFAKLNEFDQKKFEDIFVKRAAKRGIKEKVARGAVQGLLKQKVSFAVVKILSVVGGVALAVGILKSVIKTQTAKPESLVSKAKKAIGKYTRRTGSPGNYKYFYDSI